MANISAEKPAPGAEPEPRTWLTWPVWLLGIVSFLADFSGEMVYPIVPLFLTGTLGAPAAAVGVVEGIAEGTANVTKLFSGRWSDRSGRRKPYVVAGYAFGTLGKVVLAAATVWPIAMVGRAVDRFGKGIRTGPRDAMLADFSSPQNRGRVFGFHRAMDTAGAIVGPLVGLFFLAVLNDQLRTVLLIALVPGVLSVFVLRWLPEQRHAPVAKASPAISLRGLPARFYVLLAITLVFMAGNSSDAFLILRGKDLGLTTTLVVLAYVTYNVVYAVLSYPAGALSDVIPRSWLLVAGYVVFAAVYLGFAVTASDVAVWPLFMVYGAYIAATDGVSKALVADVVPGDVRASAMGLFQGLAGLAALVASVGAGLLWTFVSESAPFWLGASCAIVAAVALAAYTLRGGFSGRSAPVPQTSTV